MKHYLNNKTICLILVFLSILIYLPWINMPYSGDESMHGLMVYLMTKGFFPIRDVYSHVTPYYLLFYGLFMAISGINMFVARMVSYFIGSAIGILVYLIVWKSFRSKLVSLLAWISVQTSLLFLREATPLSAMGHSLVSSFFSLITIYIIMTGFSENKFFLFKSFLFGFCIAFAIWSRHITVFVNTGLFIIGILSLWRIKEIQKTFKIKATMMSLIGIITCSSFMIYLFFSRPDTFLFAYLHGTRLMGVMREIGFAQTIRPFSFEPLALGSFLKSFNGQTALLISFVIFSILLILDNRRYRRYANIHSLSLWVIFSLTGSYLIFSKHGFTWHYLGVLSPFFIIAGSPFFFYLWEKLRKKQMLGILLLSIAALHSLYGVKLTARKYLEIFNSHFVKTGEMNIQKLGSNDPKQLKIIAQEISKILPKNGKLLSCNSALYYEMDILPPFRFGYWESLGEHTYATKGDKNLNKHHLLTEEQVLDMFNKHYFDVVLVDTHFPGVSGGSKLGINETRNGVIIRYKEAVSRNYSLYKEIGKSKIYILKEK